MPKLDLLSCHEFGKNYDDPMIYRVISFDTIDPGSASKLLMYAEENNIPASYGGVIFTTEYRF